MHLIEACRCVFVICGCGDIYLNLRISTLFTNHLALAQASSLQLSWMLRALCVTLPRQRHPGPLPPSPCK